MKKITSLRFPVTISILLCLMVVFLFSSFSSHAFQQDLRFKQLNNLNGLSNSPSYGVIQDEQGFIWMATQDGLTRYDGENFIQYVKNTSNQNSLADNFVRKVFIDNNNTLWVGTENGLSRYNKNQNNFDNFYSNKTSLNSLRDNFIWDIYQDHNNNILVSTEQGLHRYRPSQNDFIRIEMKVSNQIKAIKTIYQDKNNHYWLGTFDDGIYITDEKFNNVFNLKENNPWLLNIQSNRLFNIKHIDGLYWLGTDTGLYVLSNNCQLLVHLTDHHDSSYYIKNLPDSLTYLKHKTLSSNAIRSIETIGNEIWLATENGLNILNKKLQKTKILKHKKAVRNSLSSNKLLDIFVDINKNVWISSLKNLNFFNRNQILFHHHFSSDDGDNQIESMAKTTDNKIWIVSNLFGLQSVDLNRKISSVSLEAPLPYFELTSFKNELWFIASDENLYQYNSQTKRLIKHEHWSKKSNLKISSNLVADEKSIWFIDKKNNLVKYSKKTENFIRYQLDDDVEIITFTLNKNTIYATSSINTLITFNINKEFFKTVNIKPINKFNLSTANQIQYSNNKIWLGSTSQGLAIIDLATNNTSIFNESNKLNNNFINAFLIKNDTAWISTNKGITYLSLIDKNVISYNEDFLLNDNVFLEKSGVELSHDRLYFGGINGVNEFNPLTLLTITNDIKKPIITNLLVANKAVKINKKENNNVTLSRNIESSNIINLTYEQSPFSIEFISPNNFLPEHIRYRYKLTGLDKDWIDSGLNNRRATYTNLNAGKYVFEVETFDSYDPNNKKSTQLIIRIRPPIWLSNAAIFSYCMVIFFIIAYFIQQFRHKNQYNIQIKASEERLKLSLWGSGDEMWDWNITAGKIYRSNIWDAIEFPQDGERNLSGQQSNIHINDLARVKSKLKEHFDKNTEYFEATYRIHDKNEQWIWVLDRGKIVEFTNDGKASRMTGTLKNISKIKKAEEKLKLFAKCIEGISDAIVIYDRQFNIVDVNQAYLKLIHKNKSELIGSYMNFSEYSARFNQDIKKQLLTKNNWQGEIQQKNDNGSQFTTEINIDIIHDEHDKVSHFVGVFSDITLRKKNEAELRKLANTDTLTELPNRSFFQSNQIRLVENKTPHALLVFDLDNFKKINDSMGHELGDILLCELAKRILEIKRLKDSVYRLGGDEFSMIIEHTSDIHTITSIAKDILRTIAIPLKPRNQEIVLYSSIGIALYPDDGLDSEELLKNADTAMYHAKGVGGNKYQFFNESMNKQAVKRLQIENLIRYGLKDDYFSVFYQPKIEIKTGKVNGMEALVRFQTPNNGIVSPGVFIPVSEETGQIIEIGEVVLRKACYVTKKWVESGLFDGRVAVNLSAVQFSQPNLVNLIAQILLESALPAKHLELEITEGTVMDSPKEAIATMLQIRAMGIHLSLDDFGTGYSSLAYLKRFPLNTLKIDKAFVDDIEESEQGRNMVATIVTIAHNLGLDVVAEGVETDNQLNFLASLNCEQLQGFLYSKPLAHKDFTNYLLSHQITDKSTTFSL